VYPVRFDRFSPYFTRPDAYGLDLHPLDFYELVYPFPEAVLQHLAYYFADRRITSPYFTAMARAFGGLQALVESWRARWRAGGERDFPTLCFVDAGTVVLDSRGQAAVRHDVGALGRRVLLALGQPLTLSLLATKLPDVKAAALDATVHELLGAALVFAEDDRFMSLVHAAAPASPRAVLQLLEAPPWSSWLEETERAETVGDAAAV
jgi:magnesium-protoporphyrin IX monomethyl ester (oxidative) cyclase